jgi:hypothetical protein
MHHTEPDALLARIRQLLAKAESTTFEAEALAFTAKAQELMTRHAIDVATLDDSTRSHGAPIVRRVSLDAPYVDAKVMLLQTIAAASRCRAVQHVGESASSVVGFADDVAAVEMLFTSLLVQAQTALTEVARRAPAGANPRSRGYRSAFLRGFAHRIGERLRDVNDAVFADVEAQRGSSFLPALRTRVDDVDDCFTASFPGVRLSRPRGWVDAAGWTGGTLAADDARFASGAVERRTA